jgi:uncharacterized repeat protein (TIGR03803 family)
MARDRCVNVFRVAVRNPILSVMLLLLAACGGSDSSSNNVALRTVGVTPASPSQQLGKTLQLVATGTYSDGTTRDVSSTATWMSSKTSVAAISAAGLVSTASIGAVTITATLDGVAGKAIMTVTPGPAIESTLYTFGTAASAHLASNSPLFQASDGDFYGTTATGGANGNGTVYKITAAGIETVLYSFGASPADAANPYASVIQASDGNFYGTTYEGGAQSYCGIGSCGTVYKITPGGVETVLHSFSDGDAYEPAGALIQASDGNFYGLAGGGANGCNSGIGRLDGCGSVYMITPAGVETVIYSFGASASDGYSPVGALIQASDGNFYGTTQKGGTNGVGTVFKVTPAGIETVLYSLGASPSDAASPSWPFTSLIQASDGNFYGTTQKGGTNGFGTVYRITAAGVETVLYSFGASPSDGVYPGGSLIQASDGNFYGMTSNGGANTCPAGSPFPNSCGTAFEITPAGVETILYSFGASASDGSNPNGNLVQASDGNFYGVTDGGGSQQSGTVFKLIP